VNLPLPENVRRSRMPKGNWKMSRKDRALLAEERLEAERAYIARVLARNSRRNNTRGGERGAENGRGNRTHRAAAPPPGCAAVGGRSAR
jgi:hypothetical protein